MARQRFVKPELFQHEELHRAEVVSALPLIRAYIGLWTCCDRRGCFDWRPTRLKLNILPFDDVDFGAVLDALEANGFIVSYVVEGKRYGWVPTLQKHQSFHKNERPNELIPDPPQYRASTMRAPSEHSASTPVLITALTSVPITTSVAVAASASRAVGGVRTPPRSLNGSAPYNSLCTYCHTTRTTWDGVDEPKGRAEAIHESSCPLTRGASA